VLNLLAAGVITRADVERAAEGGADPGPTAAPAEPSAVTNLLALPEGACRWPTGDIPAIDFCGAPVVDEASSYCDFHRAAAYLPGKFRPSALVRLARVRLAQPREEDIELAGDDDASLLEHARDRAEVVLELAP
jgi:hypothetical protein